MMNLIRKRKKNVEMNLADEEIYVKGVELILFSFYLKWASVNVP